MMADEMRPVTIIQSRSGAVIVPRFGSGLGLDESVQLTLHTESDLVRPITIIGSRSGAVRVSDGEDGAEG